MYAIHLFLSLAWVSASLAAAAGTKSEVELFAVAFPVVAFVLDSVSYPD